MLKLNLMRVSKMSASNIIHLIYIMRIYDVHRATLSVVFFFKRRIYASVVKIIVGLDNGVSLVAPIHCLKQYWLLIREVPWQSQERKFIAGTTLPFSSQRKNKSLALIEKGIKGWPVDSPQKGTIMRKAFPRRDVTMRLKYSCLRRKARRKAVTLTYCIMITFPH